MSATAYIALGSNVGDRHKHLHGALQALRQTPGIRVGQISAFYETRPAGGPEGQENYLNAAAVLETDLDPHSLLRRLLAIESQLGRERNEPNGPRTIDLDLLLYDDLVIDEPGLVVPHARLHERPFVLKPLAEIAPHIVHPLLGATIDEIWRRLPAEAPGAIVRAVPISENKELTGLRALVTGSTSGIGLATAQGLQDAGAQVLFHGRHRRPTLSDQDLILADLTEPSQCERLIDEAWNKWGGLEIWVNNAGADTLTGEAAAWSFAAKLEALLAVDVRATALLSRLIGERMRQCGRGAIINIGWDQADTGMEGDSGQLFALSKGAVMAFTKSLAVSLAPEVRVNCVAPGWIRTAWGERASPIWQERVQRETPLRRWGTPADIAATVRWLVSPAAEYITGQVIRVNGGAVR